MNQQSDVAAHRRTGSLRAQRALAAASVDFESPVDVFSAIERERVWLMFQPLDNLYGAYRRHETPGVIVHSGHPRRLQRFTAAHELGHHLLGHDVSVDSKNEVESASDSLPIQEIEAQAFAATFLMPVQLVNRALSHLGLPRRPHSLDPTQAYRLSLELGSSYAATITQLRALDRITFSNARDLRRTRPIDIKTGLALGEQLASSRADVWPLNLDDSGRELWIAPGDEVHARLPETPTSGYRWRPDNSPAQVEVAGDAPVTQNDEESRRYGGVRQRHLWWRALEPSEIAIAAELRRSFEPVESATAKRFEVSLHVVASPTGSADHGISRRQLQLL